MTGGVDPVSPTVDGPGDGPLPELATTVVPGSRRAPVATPSGGVDLPETLRYRLKNVLLGPPIASDRQSSERLGKPTALAVLSSDVISSSAYATEQMLIPLVIAIGVAAFSLVVPVTIAVIFVLLFVTLSYLEVVKVYTKAGGAYVVARENFGLKRRPDRGHVPAHRLHADGGRVGGRRGVGPHLGLPRAEAPHHPDRHRPGDPARLRQPAGHPRGRPGLRRPHLLLHRQHGGADRRRALPGRSTAPSTPTPSSARARRGTRRSTSGAPASGLLYGATIFIVLQAFASGGSALTGTEAISNGVSVFRRPESRNARITLVLMARSSARSCSGSSLLASVTHPVPYESGTPTVISQVAKYVYGTSATGQPVLRLLQVGTMLILILAANTSFTGFPFLASFAAEDSYLPRQLTKRGHRLVFSTGIIVLTVVSHRSCCGSPRPRSTS